MQRNKTLLKRKVLSITAVLVLAYVYFAMYNPVYSVS